MEELLHKCLNHEPLSDSELQSLASHPEYAAYVKIARQSSGYTSPEFDEKQLFDKIKAAQSYSLKEKANSQKERSLFRWIPMAASFLLLIAAGFYMLSGNSVQNITTQFAEQTTLELPDGSTVILNAQSSLSYNEKNWDEERLVVLEGQAYFKVETGDQFTVKTTQGEVTVLGTQFNVNDRDGIFQVNCYEGKVSVSSNDDKVILTHHRGARLENETLKVTEISTNAPSWIVGESSFEQIAFKDVILELQRQYDVQVDYDSSLNSILFTGSFTHNNLEIALKSISSSMNISYKIEERRVILTP